MHIVSCEGKKRGAQPHAPCLKIFEKGWVGREWVDFAKFLKTGE